MASNRKVMVLAGDGIGQEVMHANMQVMEWLAKHRSLGFDVSEGLVGGVAYEAHGVPLTDETLADSIASDAVLFGAVGNPKYDDLPFELKPERGLLALRKELDLFANLRPALVFEPLVEASTLKPEVISGLDILILRELCGGVYFAEPRGIDEMGDGQKKGYDTNAYTTSEIEQVNVILSFITDHPNSLYIYDPVFGDNGALYVDSLIAEKSKSTLLPLATITTPNMFELSYLSQMEVSGIDSAIKASKIIQSNGPEWVLSTGIYSGETEIADILVTPNDVRIFGHKRQHTGVSGAGDTLTAILTSLLVSGEPLENAARKACIITQSLIGLSNSPQSMPPLTLDLLRK